MSSTNAPEARYIHVLVWTGTEVIAWGGWNGTSYVNTGGRYNPTKDTWTTMTTTNAPTARAAQPSIWTGEEMIIWGGSIAGNTTLNTGGKYNPTTDTWTSITTTSAPDDRTNHSVAWTGEEMIVWGGRSWDGGGLMGQKKDVSNVGWTYLDNGGKYNPESDSWTTISSTNDPSSRAIPQNVWTGSEMIIWGGYNGVQLGDGFYLGKALSVYWFRKD